MELHKRNQSEQLPYEKLALLAIDRQKADNLQKEVKERLVSGEVTPLMQVSISARNGDVITLPLKLQMTADKDGNPALLAYPVRAELETERNKVLRLTPQEAERLAKGEVLQKAVEVNGEKWILSKRHKTKVAFQVKLLDIPLQIVERYRPMQKDNRIFPGLNYWSICKPLKRMIRECGITKSISFHCSRHGFATLALSKGMPIESVSRVLGHTNIVTTQLYAKITTQKLDNDLTMFGDKLSKTFNGITMS